MSDTTDTSEPDLPKLTAKQIETLQTALDIRRTNSKDLAAKLGVKSDAINGRFKRIYRLWPVTNRDEAVDLAEKRGVIKRREDNG